MSKESFINPNKKPNSVCPFHDERAYPDMHRQSQNIQRVRGDLRSQADNYYELTQKEEVYALTSLVIPATVNETIERRSERGPFGLLINRRDAKNSSLDFTQSHPLQNFYLGQEYDQLESAMRYTLFYDLKRLAHSARYNSVSIPEETRDNFQSLEDALTERSGESGYTFIGRGINTAARVMSNVLSLIPTVVSREIPEEASNIALYSEVAKNSYSFLRDFSKQHVSTFREISDTIEMGNFGDHLRRSPYYHEYFTLNDNLQLRLTDNLKVQVEQQNLDNLDIWFRITNPTLGCPAVYGQSIKKLWDWHVDIGRHIWQQQAERELNG